MKQLRKLVFIYLSSPVHYIHSFLKIFIQTILHVRYLAIMVRWPRTSRQRPKLILQDERFRYLRHGSAGEESACSCFFQLLSCFSQLLKPPAASTFWYLSKWYFDTPPPRPRVDMKNRWFSEKSGSDSDFQSVSCSCWSASWVHVQPSDT